MRGLSIVPTLALDLSNIVNGYIGGQSVLALSRQYNTSTNTINKILKNNNVSKISQAQRLNPSLKESYFKSIDNKEKAYWIGWLLTDGSISSSNDIEIALSAKDKHILGLFEKDLGINNHIKPFQEQYVRFVLCSKKMAADLVPYGIVPNKTLNLKFPKNIPEQFETHLLRGMFDGDGGLTLGMATRFYKHRNKSYTKPYQELSFTGTYDMCRGFQNTILKYINISEKRIAHNHSVYRVRWSNKDEIIQILDLLYTDCDDHYLDRKYKLYLSLKDGAVS